MAILIDRLRSYDHGARGVHEWCHMVSDQSVDELHSFASAIGLKPSRFHRDHYDLLPEDRDRAVAANAIEVASKELVQRMIPARVPRREREGPPTPVNRPT